MNKNITAILLLASAACLCMDNSDDISDDGSLEYSEVFDDFLLAEHSDRSEIVRSTIVATTEGSYLDKIRDAAKDIYCGGINKQRALTTTRKIVSVGSPLKKHMVVHHAKVSRVSRRLDFDRNSEESAIKLDKTNLTDPKNRNLGSYEYTREVANYQPITRSTNNFCVGKFAFINPLSARNNVLIDAGEEAWSDFVDEFFAANKVLNKEKQLIAESIIFIHENKDLIRKLIMTPFAQELVCRHFATFSLPIFSRVLNDQRQNHRGDLVQISGREYDDNWRITSLGHVWFCIRFSNGNTWFVDVYNKIFINLSQKTTNGYFDVNNLKTYRIKSNNQIYTYRLENSIHTKAWVKLSIKKLNLRKISKFYGDDEREQKAIEQLFSNYPLESSFIEMDVDEL